MSESEIPEDPSAGTVRLIEAMLFLSPDPLPLEAIVARLPPDQDPLPALEQLEATYRSRGINLSRIAGGWCFHTAPDLAQHLRKPEQRFRRLGRAQSEILAIIAYHQPVTRAAIEEIRGVSLASSTIDLLLETGWIRPGSRLETAGRPLTWATTPAFLEHFGLASLDDLPNLDELKASGLLDSRPRLSLGDASTEDLDDAFDSEG